LAADHGDAEIGDGEFLPSERPGSAQHSEHRQSGDVEIGWRCVCDTDINGQIRRMVTDLRVVVTGATGSGNTCLSLDIIEAGDTGDLKFHGVEYLLAAI